MLEYFGSRHNVTSGYLLEQEGQNKIKSTAAVTASAYQLCATIKVHSLQLHEP